MISVWTLRHAALCEEGANDSGEHGDDELDDGLPLFNVFEHNNTWFLSHTDHTDFHRYFREHE